MSLYACKIMLVCNGVVKLHVLVGFKKAILLLG